MNTDRWYYRVFQSAPDRLYRFEALEIKELSHRLDGVLWPRQSTGCAETGSPEFPVVLLEVQMHPDRASTTAWQHRPIGFCNSSPRWSTGRCW